MVYVSVPRYRSESLEFDFKMFLIFEYFVLPSALIILRCATMKCVPKCDIFWLYNCITTWSWIGVFITIFGTNLYCTKDCGPFGGITDFPSIFAMIVFCSVSFLLSLFEMLYGVCTINEDQPLPIQFDPTPVDKVRDIIARIDETGPTMIVGAVKETDCVRYKNGKTSFWELIGFEQFAYKSWINITTYPYFDSDQTDCCMSRFQDLEDVFNHHGPIVIKTSLAVVPANEETRTEYDEWSLITSSRIKLGSKLPTREFREELVTDQQLCNSRSHRPSKLIHSAQLPSLTTVEPRITFAHVMEAKDRLLCDDPPYWMNESLYRLATYLLLGPVYRICYWMSVRVVKLHFKKAFNTQDEWKFITKQRKEINPYKNNIDGLVVNTFS